MAPKKIAASKIAQGGDDSALHSPPTAREIELGEIARASLAEDEPPAKLARVIMPSAYGNGNAGISTAPTNYELAVTAEQIAARIRTCIGVAVHHIRDADAAPVDGVLPACLAELDALKRIIPAQKDSTAP